MLTVSDEVRAYLKQVGSIGGKVGSRTAKSIAAKRTSERRWKLRRAKYGPTGYTRKPGWYTKTYGPPIPSPAQPVTGDTGAGDKESGKDQPIPVNAMPPVD
jgi:hypothetical protein